MSAEDKSETLSIVSSNRSTVNISSDSTERMETPPVATSATSNGGGVDNQGFVEDEKKTNEFEAVNLELVDLNKPTTQLTEPRVYAPPQTLTPTQKFTDYYVSVNEHKKGIRGEKLYVTKDSRRGPGCKRYCCAFLVFLVVILTVTIATLVGTGIIDPQPQIGDKSGRSRDLPPVNSTTPSFARPILDKDANVNEDISQQTISPINAVPNVLEGEMTITNVAWDERLLNSSDPFFEDLASKFVEGIYPVLVTPKKEEKADFFIKVMNFSRGGGVTPHYRVGWELKDNSFSDGVDLITTNEISSALEEHIKDNQGRLSGLFSVPLSSIRVKRVADDQCENMGCQSFCSYDYSTNEFQCGCSRQYKLGEDGKSCIFDNTDPTIDVNLLNGGLDYIIDDENDHSFTEGDIPEYQTNLEGITESVSENQQQKTDSKVPRLLDTNDEYLRKSENYNTTPDKTEEGHWHGIIYHPHPHEEGEQNKEYVKNESHEWDQENVHGNVQREGNMGHETQTIIDKGITEKPTAYSEDLTHSGDIIHTDNVDEAFLNNDKETTQEATLEQDGLNNFSIGTDFGNLSDHEKDETSSQIFESKDTNGGEGYFQEGKIYTTEDPVVDFVKNEKNVDDPHSTIIVGSESTATGESQKHEGNSYSTDEHSVNLSEQEEDIDYPFSKLNADSESTLGENTSEDKNSYSTDGHIVTLSKDQKKEEDPLSALTHESISTAAGETPGHEETNYSTESQVRNFSEQEDQDLLSPLQTEFGSTAVEEKPKQEGNIYSNKDSLDSSKENEKETYDQFQTHEAESKSTISGETLKPEENNFSTKSHAVNLSKQEKEAEDPFSRHVIESISTIGGETLNHEEDSYSKDNLNNKFLENDKVGEGSFSTFKEEFKSTVDGETLEQEENNYSTHAPLIDLSKNPKNEEDSFKSHLIESESTGLEDTSEQDIDIHLENSHIGNLSQQEEDVKDSFSTHKVGSENTFVGESQGKEGNNLSSQSHISGLSEQEKSVEDPFYKHKVELESGADEEALRQIINTYSTDRTVYNLPENESGVEDSFSDHTIESEKTAVKETLGQDGNHFSTKSHIRDASENKKSAEDPFLTRKIEPKSIDVGETPRQDRNNYFTKSYDITSFNEEKGVKDPVLSEILESKNTGGIQEPQGNEYSTQGKAVIFSENQNESEDLYSTPTVESKDTVVRKTPGQERVNFSTDSILDNLSGNKDEVIDKSLSQTAESKSASFEEPQKQEENNFSTESYFGDWSNPEKVVENSSSTPIEESKSTTVRETSKPKENSFSNTDYDVTLLAQKKDLDDSFPTHIVEPTSTADEETSGQIINTHSTDGSVSDLSQNLKEVKDSFSDHTGKSENIATKEILKQEGDKFSTESHVGDSFKNEKSVEDPFLTHTVESKNTAVIENPEQEKNIYYPDDSVDVISGNQKETVDSFIGHITESAITAEGDTLNQEGNAYSTESNTSGWSKEEKDIEDSFTPHTIDSKITTAGEFPKQEGISSPINEQTVNLSEQNKVIGDSFSTQMVGSKSSAVEEEVNNFSTESHISDLSTEEKVEEEPSLTFIDESKGTTERETLKPKVIGDLISTDIVESKSTADKETPGQDINNYSTDGSVLFESPGEVVDSFSGHVIKPENTAVGETLGQEGNNFYTESLVGNLSKPEKSAEDPFLIHSAESKNTDVGETPEQDKNIYSSNGFVDNISENIEKKEDPFVIDITKSKSTDEGDTTYQEGKGYSTERHIGDWSEEEKDDEDSFSTHTIESKNTGFEGAPEHIINTYSTDSPIVDFSVSPKEHEDLFASHIVETKSTTPGETPGNEENNFSTESNISDLSKQEKVVEDPSSTPIFNSRNSDFEQTSKLNDSGYFIKDYDINSFEQKKEIKDPFSTHTIESHNTAVEETPGQVINTYPTNQPTADISESQREVEDSFSSHIKESENTPVEETSGQEGNNFFTESHVGNIFEQEKSIEDPFSTLIVESDNTTVEETPRNDKNTHSSDTVSLPDDRKDLKDPFSNVLVESQSPAVGEASINGSNVVTEIVKTSSNDDSDLLTDHSTKSENVQTDEVRADIFSDIVHKFVNEIKTLQVDSVPTTTIVNDAHFHENISTNQRDSSYNSTDSIPIKHSEESFSFTRPTGLQPEILNTPSSTVFDHITENKDTAIENTRNANILLPETVVSNDRSSEVNPTVQTITRNLQDTDDIVNKVGDIINHSDNILDTRRTNGILTNSESRPLFNNESSHQSITSPNLENESDINFAVVSPSEKEGTQSVHFDFQLPNGTNQNIFTNGTVDPSKIQKIIFQNFFGQNQTNPFKQDSQPFQFGLQYPNGTEAVFNYNGTVIDPSQGPIVIEQSQTDHPSKFNFGVPIFSNGTQNAPFGYNTTFVDGSGTPHFVFKNGSNPFKDHQGFRFGLQFPNGTQGKFLGNSSQSQNVSPSEIVIGENSLFNGTTQILPNFSQHGFAIHPSNETELQKLILQSLLQQSQSGNQTKDSTEGFQFPNESDIQKLVLENVLQKFQGEGSNETLNFGGNSPNGSLLNFQLPNQEDVQKQILRSLIEQSQGNNQNFSSIDLPNNADINKQILEGLYQRVQGNNQSFNGFTFPNGTPDGFNISLPQFFTPGNNNGSNFFSTLFNDSNPNIFANSPIFNSNSTIQHLNESEIKKLVLNSLNPNVTNFQPLSESEIRKIVLENSQKSNHSDEELLRDIVFGSSDSQSETTNLTLETTTEKDMGDIVEIIKSPDEEDTDGSKIFKILSGTDFSDQIKERMEKSSRKIDDLQDKKCKDPINEFKCLGHGNCLHKSLRCNGIYDCRDGSDELLCGRNGFEKEECKDFQCPNGPCISLAKVCDGKSDCPGSRDELDCGSNCTQNEFHCVKDGRCIPLGLRCDGTPDCLREDEDERECECDPDKELSCKIGGGCYPKEKRCDGVPDCPDFSDEAQCLRLNEGGALQIRNAKDSWSTMCFNNKPSQKWASKMCQQLGFSDAELKGEQEEKQNSYKILEDTSFSESQFNIKNKGFTDVDSCPNNPKVNCVGPHKCGNWTLKDDLLSELVSAGSLTVDSSMDDHRLWPSLAYLFNVKKKTSCTVSILNTNWLITSHSCIEERSLNPFEWVAFSGPTNSNSTTTQIKVVKRIISHPSVRFLRGYYTDDLALVELLDPFEFTDNVGGACIADTSYVEDKLCFVAGWSDVNKEGVSFRQYLDRVPTPLMSFEECNSESHYNGALNQNVLCTSSKFENVPCRSDGGAPLMCLDEDRWKLYGVLSREGECHPSSHPDIFTSVEKWNSWIMSVIQEN